MRYFLSFFHLLAMRLSQVVAVVLSCLLVALAIILGLAAKELARLQPRLAPMVAQRLEQTLGRDVRIGAVHIEGLNRIVIADAAVAKGSSFDQGTALTAPQTVAQVDLLGLALHRGRDPLSAVSRVTMKYPAISVQRNRQGQWDIHDVIDRLQKMPSRSGWQGQFLIDHGRVAYQDAGMPDANGQPMRQHVVNVEARVSPASWNQGYAFQVSGTDARQQFGTVQLAGLYSRRTGTTRLQVNAKHVDVKELARYLPAKLPIVLDNGQAALHLSAFFNSLPSPHAARSLNPSELTAEVDLKGVGLRLGEMSTPIVATSGRLRLIPNRNRYPRGSRLELLDVHARAAQLPVTLSGKIDDLNLFDLSHMHPLIDLHVETAVQNGEVIRRLFPGIPVLAKLQVGGGVQLSSHVTGRPGDLHIDGQLHSDRIALSDAQAEGVTATFQVRPGAASSANKVNATVHVARAKVGDAELSGIAVTAGSASPWKQLAHTPLVIGQATARSAHMPWGEAENAGGHFTGTRDEVVFQEAHAQAFGGQLAGTVHFPFVSRTNPTNNTVRATLHYTGVKMAQLAKLLKVKDLTGTGSGTLDLAVGPHNRVLMDTALTGTGVKYRDYETSLFQTKVRAVFEQSGVTVEIPTADVHTAYGDFHIADGKFAHTGSGDASNETLSVPLQGSHIALSRFATALQGTATLEGSLHGDARAPVLTASIHAANGTAVGHPFQQGDADLEMQGDKLQVRNLRIACAGMSMQLPSGVGFDPRQGFQGVTMTVQLHGASVDDVLAFFNQQSPWKVEGQTEGTVDLHFTEQGVAASGSVAVPNAVVHIPTDQEYVLRLNRLGLAFDYANRQLQIRDLQLDRQQTTIHATGTAICAVGGTPRIDLAFTGDHVRLQDLPADLLGVPVALAGPAQIHGTLQGPLSGTEQSPLQVTATVAAPQLAMEGLPLGSGAIDLTYRYHTGNRELLIRQATLANDAFHIAAAGQFALDRSEMSGVSLSLNQIDLAAIRGLATQAGETDKLSGFASLLSSATMNLAGHGQMQLTADGPYSKPSMTMSFDLAQLAVGKMPLPNLRAKLASEYAGGRMQLRIREAVASGGAGEGSARISGLVDQDGRIDLQYAAEAVTAKWLSNWVGRLPFDGSLDATGTVVGPWKTPVVEGDLQVVKPLIAGHELDRFRAHLRLGANELAISNGTVWVMPQTQPLAIAGEIPICWVGPLHPQLRAAQPIALNLTIPRQNLALVRAFFPAIPAINGTIEGNVQIGGTAVAPIVRQGHLAVAGAASLPVTNPEFPNLLNNIDLRLSLAGDGRENQVKVERFTATLDHDMRGRPRDFKPGLMASEGAITIPGDQWNAPDRWGWNLYANVVHLPLPASVCMIPQISASLHMVSDANGPVLRGVALVENVTVKAPKIAAGGRPPQWGPLSFNPRLALVLQVGQGVKVKQSIVSLPLLPTPLTHPQLAESGYNALSPVTTGYDYQASMLNPGTSAESSGTWAVVTGSLADPHLYARFEVEKKKLHFPFNLIGSIKHAKGHITYSVTQGPHIDMGIPDFQTK